MVLELSEKKGGSLLKTELRRSYPIHKLLWPMTAHPGAMNVSYSIQFNFGVKTGTIKVWKMESIYFRKLCCFLMPLLNHSEINEKIMKISYKTINDLHNNTALINIMQNVDSIWYLILTFRGHLHEVLCRSQYYIFCTGFSL